MKKITYKELFEALESFSKINNSEVNTTTGKTLEIKDKLTYACFVVAKELNGAVGKYKKKLATISQDFASEDEKGMIIITPEGKYKYTKAGADARDKAVEELGDSTIEVKPYIVKVSDCPRIHELPLHVLSRMNGILWEVDMETYNGTPIKGGNGKVIAMSK